MKSTSAKTLVGIQSGLKFAKSPRWNRQKFLFLDSHDRCIKSVDLNGTIQTVKTLSFMPGCLGVFADGGLVVGDAWGRKIYRWAAAVSEQLADLSGFAKCCLSECVVDGSDGIYVTDVGFNFQDPLVDPVSNGVIVRVGADGKPAVVAVDLYSPSGIVITPDNKTLIVAETLAHRLTAFEIVSDGSLQNRRVWAQFQDEIKPEGICLDSRGAVWIAGARPWALRVQEGGEIDSQVITKRPVFAVTLGGPNRRHLLLCTSDSNDPVLTRRASIATIDIAEVTTPGCGIP